MNGMKKKYKFHGIMSLILVNSALILGIVSVFQKSRTLGFINIAIAILWVFPVACFFCRKCPCRLDCGHVIFGLITRIIPEKKPGNYTFPELIGTLIPILIVVLFPQYWLWQNKILFGIFWGIFALAGVEVILFVCKNCSNEFCPMLKGKE